ncbi:MAG: carbohydrate-binding protein [Salinivirgaceae bacterium]
MIINLKERIIIRQLLFILLGVFLFTTGLNAQEVSIQVGSTTREMIIYAPPGIEPNRPLIISMHGMNQTMYDQKNQTQFQSVAQANNFVLVFPQSNGSQWQLWGTSDIDFILAIIDEMYTQYGIDRDRVYLSGFSMGGMMTYYAATQIADKIAAFAPVSGFLMSGPNAVSSRPIPIIHIHGADDNYVPVSDVQTHMDAWIARNGCPTTAVVTNPYPANVPTAKSIKKYWGPGNDGVEIVFISVAGVGHWYSDNNWSADGIFTSQEIWNFCMKYSLKDGVPEFKYASVNDTNPKQIQLSLSAPIVDSIKFTGFTVKIDNQVVAIDSVVIGDTNQLVINLHDSILNDNEITLAYSNGNVFSILEKELISFNDTLVDNLLKGASPRILELSTNENGSALFANFNMNMKIPSDVSGLSLNAEYNGLFNLPILQVSFFENDSTILYFQVSETVYRDYELTFSYLGNSIVSADSGLLKTISDFPVTNNSNGLPVHINSGKIEADGITLTLEFSKAMALVNGQSSYIKLNKNGENAVINGSSVSNNSIILSLSKSVHYGDTVTISYTPGTIKAADNGPLESFTDFTINNQVNAPTWIQIPGKIEAENFTFKSGMQTEATGDAGGGLNLGYIGDGNWLEYTIENNSSETEYQISFRIAAPSTGGIIDFYIDDINAGQITTPNTGNWQVYKSVVADISITQGKHYLKVVATKAGFNLNYIDIQGLSSGLRELTRADITIYPNPAWNEMTISSVDFRHNKIEVYNTLGGLVMSKATAGEPVLRIPINLFNGIYFVKICNDKQYLLKKLMVANE